MKGALLMRNLACRSAEFNVTANLFKNIAVHASNDTIEIFFPKFPKGLIREIKRLSNREGGTEKSLKKSGWIRKCEDRSGFMLVLQKPSPTLILEIEPYREKFRGAFARIDIAYDFEPKSDALSSLLRTQTVLRWKAKGAMLDLGATTYFTQQSARTQRRSDRDIAFYDDKKSKVTQEDCCHFELRFQNADAVRRQGIVSADDILNLNPKELFEKHVRLVYYDAERAKHRFIKECIREERLKYRKQSNRTPITLAFVDRYRASLHRRLASVWDRSQCDRAQMFAQFYPKSLRRMQTRRDITLHFPTRLS